MTCDVLIVGAGPAGAVAATVLARAGARVQMIDRAHFPRPKLCGDTLNPGALADLRRLGLAHTADVRGLRLDGMRVTGEGGVTIESAYPAPAHGRALTRSDFDTSLVEAAVAAGVRFTPGVSARCAHVEDRAGVPVVAGVFARSRGVERLLRARVTIAADGRHSTLAFGLGLASHPPAVRRWAIGAYAEGVEGLTGFGEMHIRRDRYIGVAPLPDGLANVCMVTSFANVARVLGDPGATLRRALEEDGPLGERCARLRLVGPPTVLGPLAVNVVPAAGFPEGLLLAGDAAGFVDPMTGDGLRFAIRGGELSAIAACRVLECGWQGVQPWLAAARAREFGSKWRFNRSLRALVGSSWGVDLASIGARLAPSLVRAIVARASDGALAQAVAT